MLVRSIKAFSTGTISMYNGEIRIIDDTTATALIADNCVTQYTEPITPTGSLSVTANGTYDVTEKASVAVAVTVATVTYDVNGGTGTVSAVTAIKGNSVELNDGTGITPPTNKTFLGWATTDNAETPDVESPYTVTGNVTLYAVYGDSTEE